MSTVKSVNHQVGTSSTSDHNFTFTAEADDGTLAFNRGSSDSSTTTTVLTVSADNILSLGAVPASTATDSSIVPASWVNTKVSNFDPANLTPGTVLVGTESSSMKKADATWASVTSELLAEYSTGTHTVSVSTATGSVARTTKALLADQAFHVKTFGAACDGTTDDTAAVQAAINAASTAGGTVQLGARHLITATLTVQENNVRILGMGGNTTHDAGTGAVAGTSITWGASTALPMIIAGSAQGLTQNVRSSIEIRRVVLNGNSVASNGIKFLSQRNGVYEDIYTYGTVSSAYTTDCWTQLTDFAEASDIQHCLFRNLTWRLIDSAEQQVCKGFSILSNGSGNFSFNLVQNCGGFTYGNSTDSVGWWINNADNNVFIKCYSYRLYTVGQGLLLMNVADANTFEGFSCSGVNGIAIQGTVSGYASNSTRNRLYDLDNANGTQAPVIDTGCYAVWGMDSGAGVFGAAHLVCCQDPFEYPALRALTGTESIHIRNTASNHAVLTDGTNTWGVAIDGSTGDLRFNRSAGSGAVNIGNGTDVRIGGQHHTVNNAVPTTGTWAVGDVCRNSVPGVGLPTEWICIVAGTPGTWVKQGVIEQTGTIAVPVGVTSIDVTLAYTEPDANYIPLIGYVPNIGARAYAIGTPTTTGFTIGFNAATSAAGTACYKLVRTM